MTKSIMANSALNAVAGLTLLATGFASSIITARLLGPEANGIVAFSLWLVMTGALVAELGTGITLLRILPQLKIQGYSDQDRRGFAAYLMQPTIISTLILLIGYGAYQWAAEHQHWASDAVDVLLVTGVLFLTQSLGAYTKNYLVGEQQLAGFLRLTLWSSALQISTVLAGAMLFGVGGALAGYVAGSLPMFLYTLRVAVARKNACGIGLPYLVKSSVILSIEFINSSIFLNRIELVFLQKDWGIQEVGFYAVGLSIANLALQLPVQLSGSLLPYYSEQIHSNPGAKLPVHVFEGVVRAMAYITLPMSFGLAAIAPSLVVAIFGQPFEPSGSMVSLLALTAAPYVFMQICTQYFYSLDRIRERTVIGVVASVVMVGGCFIAVPYLAGEGAALVRLLAFTVMCVLMVRVMKFEGSMRPMFITIGKISAASLLCSAVAYGVSHALPLVPGLFAGIGAGAVVYFLMIRLLSAVPRDDVAILQRMADRLPRRVHPFFRQALAMLSPSGV